MEAYYRAIAEEDLAAKKLNMTTDEYRQHIADETHRQRQLDTMLNRASLRT